MTAILAERPDDEGRLPARTPCAGSGGGISGPCDLPWGHGGAHQRLTVDQELKALLETTPVTDAGVPGDTASGVVSGLTWNASEPPVEVPSFEMLATLVSLHSTYLHQWLPDGLWQICAVCGERIQKVSDGTWAWSRSATAEARHLARVIRERLLNQ